MIEADATMGRDALARFLMSLKKLRDGLDDFNCQVAAIDGSARRLGALCEETAVACPAVAQELRSFGGITTTFCRTFWRRSRCWRLRR